MLSPQLGFTPWSVIDGFSITPLWLGLRLCSFNISPYKVFKSIICSYRSSHFKLPTSYFLLPTSYFLLHTSYFILPTSYFILHTSYFLSTPIHSRTCATFSQNRTASSSVL